MSVCSPFPVRCIGRQMFLCTICALEHLCTYRQPNICAQTVDKYFGRQFAVRLCTNVCAQTVDLYIRTKRKRNFNENQENNTLGECKQLSQEKKSNIGPIRWTANVFLVHKRLRGQIYIRLLSKHRTSVCCPKLFAVYNNFYDSCPTYKSIPSTC